MDDPERPKSRFGVLGPRNATPPMLPFPQSLALHQGSANENNPRFHATLRNLRRLNLRYHRNEGTGSLGIQQRCLPAG